jgi:mono/diheme cytochrome c family protein
MKRILTLAAAIAAALPVVAEFDASKLPPASDKKGVTFEKDIKPLFERSCFKCHGAEKQKGKLRLDDRALALQGGASGKPAITPGDPGRSEIIRASLLPKNHDEAMPPEGKEPLTEVELAALIRWIQEGASY